METLDVKLSGNGMANIPRSKMVNDFEFIVGGRHYACPWFIADFISPTVGRLHSFDPTVNEFYIDITDSENQFCDFLSLGFGSTLRACDGNFSFFRSVCRELNNQEVYESLIAHFEGPLTLSNACERLIDYDFFGFSPQPIIEFVASHFFELVSSISFELPVRTFAEILSHPSLRILDEDSLYDIISSRFDCDSKYFDLVQYIRFEYLSPDRISKFILWVSTHFDRMNFGIWNSLSCRLKYQISANSRNSRSVGSFHALHVNAPLEGIIASLTHRSGGNVHDLGVVNVSGTVCSDTRRYAAKNAVDIGLKNYFFSKDEPNQWICYDFKNRRVRSTHYSIYPHADNHYLGSWAIEGSLDNVSWVELDRRDGNTDMNADHPIGTFSVSVTDDVDYQFIRLRQTGKNSRGNDCLVLYAFEIFGRLIE
jgi:hypothetical protein